MLQYGAILLSTKDGAEINTPGAGTGIIFAATDDDYNLYIKKPDGTVTLLTAL